MHENFNQQQIFYMRTESENSHLSEPKHLSSCTCKW